jgi:hypothetical protein
MDAADVQAWRSSLSNWGRWGPDDLAGTLNHITDERRLAALDLVRLGQSVSCARRIAVNGESDDVGTRDPTHGRATHEGQPDGSRAP